MLRLWSKILAFLYAAGFQGSFNFPVPSTSFSPFISAVNRDSSFTVDWDVNVNYQSSWLQFEVDSKMGQSICQLLASLTGKIAERETETETETERQRETERDRERQRETDRQTGWNVHFLWERFSILTAWSWFGVCLAASRDLWPRLYAVCPDRRSAASDRWEKMIFF